MRSWLVASAVLAAVAGGGCGVSVSATGGVITNDAPYRAAWEKGWSAVQRDSIPYAPTNASPGVCNAGGNKSECYETDARVAGDLRNFVHALRHVQVPGPWRNANAQTLAAVDLNVHALDLRMSSLRAGSSTYSQRDTWFRRAKILMLKADGMLRGAYAAFPSWAQPAPAPQY
jgi:hypothetical protein